MSWPLVAAAAVGLYLLTRKGSTGPARTVDFPYKDDAYLKSGESLGGRVHVADGTRDGARLVVFLHGTNAAGQMHRTFERVKPLADENTVVAAPSFTRDAPLWQGFSLDEFVEAASRAAGVEFSEVIVAGHSGAACFGMNGPLMQPSMRPPSKVVVIDGCMTSGYGEQYGKLGEKVPVEVYYQTSTWPRDFQDFAKAFRNRGKLVELKGPWNGGDPHTEIVVRALKEALT